MSGWVWSAILLVGDPVKKNRQSANKKFPAHNPSLLYDPPTREACHLRIIPNSFTYKNKKLLLLSVSDICQRKRVGRTGRGWPITFKFLPQITSLIWWKYSLFKRIGLCPISLTTPLVYGFKICMKTLCQIWGILGKLFYLAYLLPVFSVNFSIYVNHLRLDTFLFTWWIIMYAPICLPMKIYCSIYFLDSCCYLFLSATIVITESFLKTLSTAVWLEIEN